MFEDFFQRERKNFIRIVFMFVCLCSVIILFKFVFVFSNNRDPHLFRHILNFLRTGDVPLELPSHDLEALTEVKIKKK